MTQIAFFFRVPEFIRAAPLLYDEATMAGSSFGYYFFCLSNLLVLAAAQCYGNVNCRSQRVPSHQYLMYLLHSMQCVSRVDLSCDATRCYNLMTMTQLSVYATKDDDVMANRIRNCCNTLALRKTLGFGSKFRHTRFQIRNLHGDGEKKGIPVTAA